MHKVSEQLLQLSAARVKRECYFIHRYVHVYSIECLKCKQAIELHCSVWCYVSPDGDMQVIEDLAFLSGARIIA